MNSPKYEINSVPNSSIQDLEMETFSNDQLSMEGNCCHTPLRNKDYEGGGRKLSKS